MNAPLRTQRIIGALGLPAGDPTPGDAIMTRLIEVEARLRVLGLEKAANTAARFQADIVRTRAPFLYERWTADIEAFADRKEREAALMRGAGLGEGEVVRVVAL